ncbi:MAG: hypothetical protein ACRELA_24410 [Candidatus Rokuibacteriota bacterium]
MTGKDAIPVDFADCDKQRGLSPAGVEASREMGEAFRLLKIPVGRVLASPYCRTRETARLAFGRVEQEAELLVGPRESGWTMEKAGEALKRLAAVPPAANVNTVLVAHVFNAMHAFGIRLEEGEALVVKPDGNGGVRVVGRVTATQWGDLTRDYLTFGERVFEMAAQGQGASSGHGPAVAGSTTYRDSTAVRAIVSERSDSRNSGRCHRGCDESPDSRDPLGCTPRAADLNRFGRSAAADDARRP